MYDFIIIGGGIAGLYMNYLLNVVVVIQKCSLHF